MADIFISYSQKDRARVKRLVDALKAEGWVVWWDLNIRAGESFDELIENTLDRVSCVVGVWSQHSVKSEWVRAESAWAKDQGIFVSVRIDDEARLPLKFYHVHTANLSSWDGSRDAASFRSLVRDVRLLAGAPKSGTAAAEPAKDSASSRIASPTHSPEPLSTFRDPLPGGGKGPEMVVIPTGNFWMGSPKTDAFGLDAERPYHQVEIRHLFALGQTPITFAAYDRFAKATGAEEPDAGGWGRGNRPVINVSWEDAVAYAEWLSVQTGKRYRLPSEAEWEYACRAGTETPWSFGSEQAKLGEYAWYRVNSGDQTQPVGEKKPNPWGLHDVHGNVFEWVQDCWHGTYDGSPIVGAAWEERVVRGGSWGSGPGLLRSAYRSGYFAVSRNNILGFRLAQSARAALRSYPEPVCPRTGRAWCAGVHEPVSRSRTEGSAE
jgi:formylglycine-generating enzyme required for sulfatase activity